MKLLIIDPVVPHLVDGVTWVKAGRRIGTLESLPVTTCAPTHWVEGPTNCVVTEVEVGA